MENFACPPLVRLLGLAGMLDFGLSMTLAR